MWYEAPFLAEDGSHTTWKAERCSATPEPFIPQQFATADGLKLMMMEARLERAVTAHERLADKMTVERADAARAFRSLGEHARELSVTRRKLADLQGALACSSSRPARITRLLLRTVKVLGALPDPCPTCRLTLQHRYNRRLDSLARAIDNELASEIGGDQRWPSTLRT